MQPLLFDTSVWIDFVNGIRNMQTDLLNTYLQEDGLILICPTIIQELLQGFKSDTHFEKIKESLSSIEKLNLNAYEATEGAAELYRTLRKKGTTSTKSNDILIAYYAIYFEITLVHKDKDFEKIAKHTNLKTITA